jgi:hypothetical protein
MSLEHSDWLTGDGSDIDPAERQKHEGEGWTIGGQALQECCQPETERTNEEIHQAREADEAMAADIGSSEGRASKPGSEDSVGAGEDGAKDNYDDNKTGNCEARGGEATEESGGELGENEIGHGECSDNEHSPEEHSHDEQCHGIYSHRHLCRSEHSHDNRSEGEFSGSESDSDEHKYSMAVKNPALAYHECSSHKREHRQAYKRNAHLPDGRELFSVLLSIHFKDTLIDYSRSYASMSSKTGNPGDSDRPATEDLEHLQNLLNVEFTDLTAGIDPLEIPMSNLKRRSLLRYTVKLEFLVGQDRAADLPLLQFMNFDTAVVLGEEALELIANIDEIVLGAIASVDDVVVGKHIVRHKLEQCLCDDEVKDQTRLEGSPYSVKNSRDDKNEQSSRGSGENKIRYLNFGHGHPLFSVRFSIHFRDTQESRSRFFVSAKTVDHDSTFELCDLDFEHLLRLIENPCNDLLNSPTFSNEENLTAEERHEQVRCTVDLDISTGLDRNEGKQYTVHMPSPFKDGMAEAIKATLEGCISDAVKTIDAIAAQRQIACKEPEYDPYSFIPDFEARRAVEKDKRLALREMEVAHLRQIVKDAYRQLGRLKAANSDCEKCSDCSSDHACGAADSHAHDHAPCNTPDSCS